MANVMITEDFKVMQGVSKNVANSGPVSPQVALEYGLRPGVQKPIGPDGVRPPADANPTCAEARTLTAADGVSLNGATSAAVKVGGSTAGTVREACGKCGPVLNGRGITDVVSGSLGPQNGSNAIMPRPERKRR